MFRRYRASTAVFIVAASLFLCSAANIIHGRANDTISIEPAELMVQGGVGAEITADLVIKNRSDHRITIMGAYELCTSVCCVSASGLPVTLAPGASTTVRALVHIGPDYGETFLWPIYIDDPRFSVISLPITCHPIDANKGS